MSESTGNTAGKKGQKLARMDLVPPYPLWLLAEVYGRGAEKYADRNWERGIDFQKSYGAMLRHALSWQAGEDVDPLDGQHHLASVAWHAFALIELSRTHPELDDRPHKKLEQEPQSLESAVTNQAEIDAAKAEALGNLLAENAKTHPIPDDVRRDVEQRWSEYEPDEQYDRGIELAKAEIKERSRGGFYPDPVDIIVRDEV